MSGYFLKTLGLQVVVVVLVQTTPVVAQSEVPAGFFRKGPGFQERVEERLDDHERRLTDLEMVSTPARSRSGGGSAGGKAPVASTSTRKAAAPAKALVHTVQAGETLTSIGRRYGVSVAQLTKANGLSADAVIRPGQKLAVSGGGQSKPAGGASSVAATKAPSGARVPPASKRPDRGISVGRHTVQRGETVRGLALRFAVSEKEFMRLNGLTDPTKLRAGAVVKYPTGAEGETVDDAVVTAAGGGGGQMADEPLTPGWGWHTVERGESLSRIAARHGRDRASLERANALVPGAPIHEGLRLKIPPAGESLEPALPVARKPPPGGQDHSVLAYQVQKGDSLEGLSETFLTTPDILRKLNRLTPGDTLAAGRRIVVPNNLFE